MKSARKKKKTKITMPGEWCGCNSMEKKQTTFTWRQLNGSSSLAPSAGNSLFPNLQSYWILPLAPIHYGVTARMLAFHDHVLSNTSYNHWSQQMSHSTWASNFPWFQSLIQVPRISRLTFYAFRGGLFRGRHRVGETGERRQGLSPSQQGRAGIDAGDHFFSCGLETRNGWLVVHL